MVSPGLGGSGESWHRLRNTEQSPSDPERPNDTDPSARSREPTQEPPATAVSQASRDH